MTYTSTGLLFRCALLFATVAAEWVDMVGR